MQELKPCPFCGRIPIIEEIDLTVKEYYVLCKCGIEESHLYRSKKAAIDKWNRRKENGKSIDV